MDFGLSFEQSTSVEALRGSASRGMQVMGSYGYAKEYEMERFYREAKLYEVAGGTTQIQRNIIARHLGIRG